MIRRASLLLALLEVTSYGQWIKTPLQRPTSLNPDLYRANANAKEEIEQAVVAAQKEGKRVLLVFGGNWCLDCHVLDNAFHQPRVEPLVRNFRVVHVDIGKADKNLDLAKKYHIDLEKGVPAVAILNGRGGLLYASAEFEKARSMTEQEVIEFLNLWKPHASMRPAR